MDSKFLKSQLLLMSKIAENYINIIPSADWFQMLRLAVDKENYITTIIETEPGPRRRKYARVAYERFVDVVIKPVQQMKRAA